jgi:NAD(P)-dependent dehydrogenase (short-subunit alcohol dehydrogenase family)
MVTIVGGIRAARTTALVSTLEARGIAVAADMFLISSIKAGELKQLTAELDRVDAEFGQLDSAVLSFDTAEMRTPLTHSDASDWMDTVTHPLLSAVQLCQAIIPHLIRKKPGGSLVFIFSEYAREADSVPDLAVVAQSALFGLAKSLAREFGSEGVRVNCVGVRRHPGEQTERQYELLGAVLDYLLSQRSAYVTGQFIQLSAMEPSGLH